MDVRIIESSTIVHNGYCSKNNCTLAGETKNASMIAASTAKITIATRQSNVKIDMLYLISLVKVP